MESTVENLSPTRVKLQVEVPFDELKPSVDAAYKKVARQVRVKGFRPGRVPPPVIDRQVGRGVVLQEAMEEAVPRAYSDALRDHDLEPLGRPEVEVTELNDGQSLKFTAEVEVRPEVTLPAYDSLQVTVDDAEVTDEALDEQIETLRDRAASLTDVDRAVGEGDYVTLDLLARVDGELVEGGEATGLSYELGSGTLVPGIDDALLGLSAGEQANFETELQGGQYAGRPAQVTVTVQSVKEKALPALDDELAVSNGFGSLEELRADLRERLGRVRRLEQGVQARDRVLEAFVDAVEVPAPEEMLEQERSARLQQLQRQVEQSGTPWERYLESEGRTAESVDAEIDDAARRSVVAQLALDAVADAEEIGVSNEELTEQIVRRAQNAGVPPQQYADAVVQDGRIGVLVAEVRRGKALAMLMESATIVDESGRPVDLDRLGDELSGGASESAEPVAGTDAEVAAVETSDPDVTDAPAPAPEGAAVAEGDTPGDVAAETPDGGAAETPDGGAAETPEDETASAG